MAGRASAIWMTVVAAAAISGTSSLAEAQPAGCRPPLERWTEVELFFGRGLDGGAVLGEDAWRDFVADVVTPLFPDGLTIVDAAGQWRGAGGVVLREPTKLLIILVPDAVAAAPAVEEVIARYRERFAQDSVLHAEQPVCVAF